MANSGSRVIVADGLWSRRDANRTLPPSIVRSLEIHSLSRLMSGSLLVLQSDHGRRQ